MNSLNFYPKRQLGPSEQAWQDAQKSVDYMKFARELDERLGEEECELNAQKADFLDILIDTCLKQGKLSLSVIDGLLRDNMAEKSLVFEYDGGGGGMFLSWLNEETKND